MHDTLEMKVAEEPAAQGPPGDGGGGCSGEIGGGSFGAAREGLKTAGLARSDIVIPFFSTASMHRHTRTVWV